MKLGVFQNGWWNDALAAAEVESVALPVAAHPSANAYESGLSDRIENSRNVVVKLAESQVGLLLDNGGTGLGFLPSESGNGSLDILHERLGLPLVSHLVDPVNTALQGLDWPTVWQALQSGSWIKAVWDRAQAIELQRFGVPNVLHLPMGAPQRNYDTAPLDARRCRPEVSFVGGQNTGFFRTGNSFPADRLLPGSLALAVQSDLPQVSFYDAYHDLFGFGAPITEADDVTTQIHKTAAYLNAKLFYNAALCMRQRDRFVIFLKRKLGDRFRLIGPRWDEAYGLRAEPPFASTEDYFNHFRESAINLNWVNGNAETGLNLRHFEITAAGGFMLCRQQPELADCFEIGTECAVFQSEQDLLEKIHFYLGHPEQRAAIALAGQRRTLSEHMFSHRLRTLLRAVQPALSGPFPEFSNTTWQQDCKAVVNAADLILDCGANVGQMAEGFRSLYPSATIYCFEPVTSAFVQLQERCAKVRAHPVKKAVADFDGRTDIHLTAGSEAHSLLGFQEGNPCAQWTRITGSETVEVCTLDRWCDETGIEPQRIDLIKLDVQGAELKALYGARKLLRHVPLVLLEVSFVPIYKDSPLLGEIESFMRENGYRRRALYPSDQPHNWGDALYEKA